MAELIFFTGTMDCGKSTLALQMDHNHTARGRAGLVLTSHDRAGPARVSSRLGLEKPAHEVTPELDLFALVVGEATRGRPVHYLICDEAQFYTGEQIEQLARLVDDLEIDVFAFGITADFRAQLFPGSKRLVELADRTQVLQVEALCWCGRRATHNARVADGQMLTDGDQVAVGDVQEVARDAATDQSVIEYEVLCRRHFMRRVTSHVARVASPEENLLPFDFSRGG